MYLKLGEEKLIKTLQNSKTIRIKVSKLGHPLPQSADPFPPYVEHTNSHRRDLRTKKQTKKSYECRHEVAGKLSIDSVFTFYGVDNYIVSPAGMWMEMVEDILRACVSLINAF